jgi:ribose transport system ATP-binding protein
MAAEPLLTLSGLTKRYATVVLDHVSLELHPGEIHALVGENGAGKSTLARILAGLVMPDAGVMTLAGRPHAPRGKPDAEANGIRMVMQELNLIGTLSIAENIFLEHLPNRLGWIHRTRLHDAARALLERVGLSEVDPDRRVDTLGIGHQQLVEIAAGLSQDCRLLILDEPTAALTVPEIDRLFEQLHNLRAAGTAVLYISHRMEEILRISDRISVLRDGRLIATRPAAGFRLEEIIRLMVGRDLGQVIDRTAHKPGRVVLRVSGLRREPVVHDVSFEAHAGEILGFAGLMGSGRTEAMRLVFGADRRDAGEIFLGGSARPARLRTPRDAVRLGLALLPESRKEHGLLLPLSIRSNLTLLCLAAMSRALGWIQTSQEDTEARRWVDRLSIRCHSLGQRVGELSGGNQQKVVLAKWLARNCDVLIFDEPTRGIDVGARHEIYQLLGRLTDEGKALVVVSSDLKELLALCDRIAVMSAGRVAAVFRRDEWTEDRILSAALSGYLTPHES